MTYASLRANNSPVAKRMKPLRAWLTAEQKDDPEKTLTWLAGELGLSVSYTCELLDGKKPSLDVAARIQDLTGISMRDFAEVA